jgi:hypothetical protein
VRSIGANAQVDGPRRMVAGRSTRVVALLALALLASACGQGGNSLSGTYYGEVQVPGPGGGTVAALLQLTDTSNTLAGTWTATALSSGQVQTFSAGLSGSVSGSQLTLDVNSGQLLGASSISGSIAGSDLDLSIPTGSGTLYSVQLVPGTTTQYNQAVAALNESATGSETTTTS